MVPILIAVSDRGGAPITMTMMLVCHDGCCDVTGGNHHAESCSETSKDMYEFLT